MGHVPGRMAYKKKLYALMADIKPFIHEIRYHRGTPQWEQDLEDEVRRRFQLPETTPVYLFVHRSGNVLIAKIDEKGEFDTFAIAEPIKNPK